MLLRQQLVSRMVWVTSTTPRRRSSDWDSWRWLNSLKSFIQVRNTGIQQGYQVWHPNNVRLAPNWTNPGLFSSDFSAFGAPRQMHWNLIWKSPGFVPFGANLTHFGAKPTIPVLIYWAVMSGITQNWETWPLNRTNVELSKICFNTWKSQICAFWPNLEPTLTSLVPEYLMISPTGSRGV